MNGTTKRRTSAATSTPVGAPVPALSIEDRLYRVKSRLRFIRAYSEARILLGQEYAGECQDELQNTVDGLLDDALTDLTIVYEAMPLKVMNIKTASAVAAMNGFTTRTQPAYVTGKVEKSQRRKAVTR